MALKQSGKPNYSGYICLNSDEVIEGDYVWEFKRGLEELYRKELFLYNARKKKISSLSVPQIIRSLEREFEEIYNNDWLEQEIVAGMKDSGIMNSLLKLSFFSEMMKIYASLSRDKVWKITKESLNNSIAKRINEHSKKEVYDSMNFLFRDENIKETFMETIAKSIMSYYWTGKASPILDNIVLDIVKTFQECSIVQHDSKDSLADVKKEIREDYSLESIYSKDALFEMEFSGRIYLRTIDIIDAEKIFPDSKRKEFHEFKVSSAQDEFRLNFARYIEIIKDSNIPILKLGQDRVVSSFYPYFEGLSEEKKDDFRRAEKKKLDEIMGKYECAPLMVSNEANQKKT